MDVNIPWAVTEALRLRSIDVLTAQEDGTAELDDSSLLQRATALRRVLVSQDQDLLREAARWTGNVKPFVGIIYAHQRRISIGDLVAGLELIAQATSLEEWQQKVEHLPFSRA